MSVSFIVSLDGARDEPETTDHSRPGDRSRSGRLKRGGQPVRGGWPNGHAHQGRSLMGIQEVVAAEGPSAGGRRGKERAARNERSSDWRRGAAGSPDPDALTANNLAGSPDPDA